MVLSEKSKIEVDSFGILPDRPQEVVKRYTLRNVNNAYVKLISLGAGVQSIVVPDRHNNYGDVLLGFDTVTGYLKNRCIGRINNMIHDQNTADDNASSFDHLDNTFESMDIINWESHVLDNRVVMSNLSKFGIPESPGYILTQVFYSWNDDNKLHIQITANSTTDIPINLTSHCVFNLADHGMGNKEIHRHVLNVNSPAKDLFHDFQGPGWLSKKVLYKTPGGSIDKYFRITNVIDRWYHRFHARLLHPKTNRYLEVYSNYPELYIKSDHQLVHRPKEKIIGKGGLSYERHGNIALIPQNRRKFLPILLSPGKTYLHSITYKFGIISQ